MLESCTPLSHCRHSLTGMPRCRRSPCSLFERNILSRASLLIYALCVRRRQCVRPLLERIDTYTRKIYVVQWRLLHATLCFIYAVCVLALAWCLSCHRDIVIALRIVLRVIARHIYVGSEKKTFKLFLNSLP